MNREEVIALEKNLKTFYQAFHDQCDKEDIYYNLEFPIPQVEGFTAHHPCTAQVAIDDAAAQIDIQSLKITVPPRSLSKKEEATKMEKFYHGCWHGVLRRDGTLFNRTAKTGYQYGVAFHKIQCDYVEPDEDKKTQDFPFLILLKHPKTVMPDPSYFATGKYSYVIESCKRKASFILAMYPEWDKGSHGLNDDIDWIEYWDDKQVIKIADKQDLVNEEHGYGFVPYRIIDAGLGYEDADGSPEKRWRGLLKPVHFDLEIEARIIYQMEAILRIQAFTPQDFQITSDTVDKGEIETWLRSYSSHPGAKNFIPYGVERAEVPTLNIPTQVFQLLGIVGSKIDAATVAKVARGERPEGAASGYMTAILAGMARIKFGAMLNSLQRAVEEENRMFAIFTENWYPEGISVWGKVDTETFDIIVKEADINSYYINEVALSSIAPEEEARRIDIGLRLYQAGAISCYRLLKNYANVTDPNAEETQKLIESVLKSPMIQEILANAVQNAPEFQEQLGGVLGGVASAPVIPPNPLGNMGNPPSPMQSGPTPMTTEMQIPLQAGSPEEQNLVTRQMLKGNVGNRINPKPSMYQR